MHWKVKALIQKGVSLLPASLSYDVYYWLQRHFGNLKKVNPVSRLIAGIEIWKRAQSNGFDPRNKVFFEVGTGRMPLVPIALWLMGANKTVTIDLNPYLEEELVNESIKYICDNSAEIDRLFGSLLIKERFDDLLKLVSNGNFSVPGLLQLCQIDYIAPGDAAETGLPDGSIDFHISYTVFEHIPPEVLKKILEEGNRLVGNKGLFIHCIDYSDHFAHSDTSISKINFLCYTNHRWSFWADNKYMYMNRMRHDDFLKLYSEAGHSIVKVESASDPTIKELISSKKIAVDKQFSNKTVEELSVIGSWLVTRPAKRETYAS